MTFLNKEYEADFLSPRPIKQKLAMYVIYITYSPTVVSIVISHSQCYMPFPELATKINIA